MDVRDAGGLAATFVGLDGRSVPGSYDNHAELGDVDRTAAR